MYQSIPYIEATTRYLERLEGSRWADYLRFGRLSRYIPSFVVGRGFACLTSKAEKKQFNGILLSICRLLTQSGVDFFYHPEMDFYSGILLYDLGDQEGFVEHAKFVARTLKLHGVQKIITVDPHTTYALKELYPKYTGVSFEVQPYFALLRPQRGQPRQRPAAGGHPRPLFLRPIPESLGGAPAAAHRFGPSRMRKCGTAGSSPLAAAARRSRCPRP